MISSEVQRTLVKSPPELWAELSDPGSLARHLGDLGEIRITRVEPEQLVEWEAENKTGKVQIKPSGWGTRVTLTVASEIPETPTSVGPAPPRPENAEDSGAEEAEAVTTPPTEEPPSAQVDEPDASAEPTVPEEPEPAAELPSDPGWPADVEPVFAPATPAALAWRKPAGQLEAQADEPIELPATEAEPLEAEPYRWLADEELEPRRGFFARLFGRRRRPRALEPDPYDEPSEAIGPAGGQSEPNAATAPDDPPNEAVEEPEEQRAEDAPEASLQAPEAVLQAPEADAQGPEADVEAPAAVVQAPAADVQAPEAVVQAPGPEAVPEPAPDAPGAADEEPALGRAEEAPHEPQATEPAQDMSAELKDAEEVAAAEVTAVLTSVLDRLGAAHHRPFSRS